MLSIQSSINELEDIKREITRNSKRNSDLRKRYKTIETDIVKYLEDKGEIGVKYKNIAIVVENKVKREVRKKKDAEDEAVRVLEEYGIDGADAYTALKKILEARKGDEIDNKRVKIVPEKRAGGRNA